MTTRHEQARAVFFSILMIVSMIAGSVGFGGLAVADGSGIVANDGTDTGQLFETGTGSEENATAGSNGTNTDTESTGNSSDGTDTNDSDTENETTDGTDANSTNSTGTDESPSGNQSASDPNKNGSDSTPDNPGEVNETTDGNSSSTGDGSVSINTTSKEGDPDENSSVNDSANTANSSVQSLNGTTATDGNATTADTGSGSTYVDIGVSELAGSGTRNDPYKISNASELQAMEDDLDANYELFSDINASNTVQWNNGSGFDPVGSDSNRFTGSFDGEGHTITGLTIDRPDRNGVGLFGYNSGTVTDVTIREITVTGDNTVGGLAGSSTQSTVANATAVGSINGTNTVGGLVGKNNGLLANATASVDVSGTGQFGAIGGLVGSNDGIVTNAKAAGSVNGTTEVGGLVGQNDYKVKNTFATGSVSGESDFGGLVGRNLATVEESYFDTQTTGQDTSAGNATGLTTAQMQGQAATTNMSGLNFGTAWQTRPDDYPALIAQEPPPVVYPVANASRVEVIANRSLAPDAVTADDVAAFGPQGESLEVTDASRDETIDQRVLVTVDAPPHRVATVRGWGVNRSSVRAARTVTAGGSNVSAYTPELVALVAENVSRVVPVYYNGSAEGPLSTGPNSRVAVLDLSSRPGTWQVDWDRDGTLDTSGADVAITARTPSLTPVRDGRDVESGTVDLPIRADAPPYYEVAVRLSPWADDAETVERVVAAGSTSVQIDGLTTGRYAVETTLRGRDGAFSTTRQSRIDVDRVAHRWTHPVPAEDIYTGIGIAATDDLVAARVDSPPSVRVFDPANGSQRWVVSANATAGHTPVAIAVTDRYVFVAGQNDSVAHIFALDATSGEVAWQRNTTALPIEAVDELAVAHGTLYAAGEDGLVALNTTTQRLQWANTNVSDVLALDADDTAVAVGTWDPNNVTFLDAADGSRRWRVQDLDGLSIRGISIRNETVYVISGVGYSNSLYEMNRSTGAVTTRDISGDFMGFAGGPSGELVLDLYPSPIVAYPPQGNQPLWKSYSLVRSEAIAVGGETLYAVGVNSWDRPIQLVAAPFPDAVSVLISGPDRVAPGTSTTYSADTVGNVSAYSWNVSGAPAGDAATTDVSFTPGVHNVTVTVRNPSGWTDTDRRRVVASVRDGIDWPRTVRPGEPATFTGQELADAGATLTWTFDDGTTIENTTAVRRYSRSGIRTVTGTVTHPDGWTATANLTVAVTQGDTVWTRDTEGIFDLTTTAETLYVGSNDGLQARVAETGDTRWTHVPNVSIPELRAVLGVAADGDGTVITHIALGEEQLWQVVTSLNASRNATWTREIGPLEPWLLGNVPVATTPSHAFVTDAEGRLLALNRTTGATAWSNASFGRIRAITTTNETVYVVASDPPDSPSLLDTTDETTQSVRVQVYALNATGLTDTANETVSVYWNRTVTAPVAAPLDQPRPRLTVTDDDRVVLALGQTVTGFRADGTVAWTYPLDGRIDEVVRNGRLVEQHRSWAATGVATAADRIYISFAQAPRSSEKPSTDSVALNSDSQPLMAERGVVALTSDGERAWMNISEMNISAVRQGSLATGGGGIAASDGRLYIGTATSLRAMRQLAAGQPAVSVGGPDTLTIGEKGRFTVQTDAETVLWPNTTYMWETPTATSTGPSLTTAFETTGTKEVSVTVDPVYRDSITSNATVTVERDSADDDPNGGEDGDDESDGGDGTDGDTGTPSFAVSELDPQNVTVTAGDTLTVTATIENIGDASGTQTVEYRIGGTTMANATVTLSPGENTTVEFTDIGTTNLVADDYEHGIFTENASQTGTLTVEADTGGGTDDSTPGFGTVVSLLALVAFVLIISRERD